MNVATELSLEPRVLLSHAAVSHADSRHLLAKAEHASELAKKHHASTGSARLTPLQEIQTQYNTFLTNFDAQLANYVGTLNETSSSTIPVSTTVTAATAAGSPLIPVQDASVFGPAGTYTTPVVATAFAGNVSIGQFTLNGSTGNNVVVNTAQSTNIALPQGTTLTANVITSASSSAASIFPSYITATTTQLALTLEIYFNAAGFEGPTKNTPPHTPVADGAVQEYLYQEIAGSAFGNSLQTVLSDITLPTTPGQDLDIYDATVQSAVIESENQVIDGIRAITAKKLLINAPSPNNRLGIVESSSSSGGTSSSSSSSSSSSGTTG